MPAESAADRLSMLDTDDFASSATIGVSTVVGILDAEFEGVDMGPHNFESSLPRFTCRTADLPSIVNGTTTATIGAVAYVIVEEQADGTGITELRLRDPNA